MGLLEIMQLTPLVLLVLTPEGPQTIAMQTTEACLLSRDAVVEHGMKAYCLPTDQRCAVVETKTECVFKPEDVIKQWSK